MNLSAETQLITPQMNYSFSSALSRFPPPVSSPASDSSGLSSLLLFLCSAFFCLSLFILLSLIVFCFLSSLCWPLSFSFTPCKYTTVLSTAILAHPHPFLLLLFFSLAWFSLLLFPGFLAVTQVPSLFFPPCIPATLPPAPSRWA